MQHKLDAIIYTLDKLPLVATNILEKYPDVKLFALHGDMGAGKTTLVNAFCKVLGVSEKTSSPTYGIASEYIGNYKTQPINICHMDWYRLRNAQEVIDSGMLEYLHAPDYYCFIEWPEIAPEILPEHTLHLQINTFSASERKISIL